jgi:hypothetical protein
MQQQFGSVDCYVIARGRLEMKFRAIICCHVHLDAEVKWAELRAVVCELDTVCC